MFNRYIFILLIFCISLFGQSGHSQIPLYPETPNPARDLYVYQHKRAVPAKSSPKDLTFINEALNEGNSLALIQVISTNFYDGRSCDGNVATSINFKALRSSGTLPPYIIITEELGGLAPFGRPSITRGPLYPNPLIIGGRYWIIFAKSNNGKYPEGVVAWWPENEAPTETLNMVVNADRYKLK